MLFPFNFTKILNRELNDECSVTQKGKLWFTCHDVRLFPRFVLEKFEIRYSDGITLTLTYREMYLTDILKKDRWMNMFHLLSSDYFCSFNKIGLLMREDESLGLYRKEYIKQSERESHKIKTFGDVFGLSWSCHKLIFKEESSSSFLQAW